jgi:hypothetical protein
VLCSWCDETATYVLLADSNHRNHDHPACDEHNAMWGRLYRRAVALGRPAVIDLRDPAEVLRATGTGR